MKRGKPSKPSCRIMIGEFYSHLKAQREMIHVDLYDGNKLDDELLFAEWIKSKPDLYVDTLTAFADTVLYYDNIFYPEVLKAERERRFEKIVLGE